MKMPVTYDKLNKIWSNSERDPNAEVRTSLTTYVWKWLAMHGDKIAQVMLIKILKFPLKNRVKLGS